MQQMSFDIDEFDRKCFYPNDDELFKVQNDRNIEWVRMNKDILHPAYWGWLSNEYKFTFDELREFKNYIIWKDLQLTWYNMRQLEEFIDFYALKREYYG